MLEHGHLDTWYIKSTLCKGFLNWNKNFEKTDWLLAKLRSLWKVCFVLTILFVLHFFLFLYLGFLLRPFTNSRVIGLQGKREGIYLTPQYHFHPLHRYLDISRAIAAGRSPLHIGSSQSRTGNLWFRVQVALWLKSNFLTLFLSSRPRKHW